MRLPEVSDRLIARIAMADPDAFEAVYDQTADLLFGMCLRILDDPGEAEDCLQAQYRALWQTPENFRWSDLSPVECLVTGARRTALGRKRVRGGSGAPITTRDLSPLVNRRGSPGAPRTLIDALETLTPARALMIRRVVLDGDSYADLANAAEVPQGTLQTSMARAVLQLADLLGAPDAAEDATVAAAEAAFGLRDTPTGDAAGGVQVAFWHGQVAALIGAELAGVAPSSQLKRRITVALFAAHRASLWQQLWPYAVGGAAAAAMLWAVSAAGLLTTP